jgi:hypothetical protein
VDRCIPSRIPRMYFTCNVEHTEDLDFVIVTFLEEPPVFNKPELNFVLISANGTQINTLYLQGPNHSIRRSTHPIKLSSQPLDPKARLV